MIGSRIVASLLAFVAVTAFVAAKPWDDVPRFPCSDVVSADGSFTAKTEPMLRWLVGYRDGVAALAVLDKRLKAIGDMDFDGSCGACPHFVLARPGLAGGRGGNGSGPAPRQHAGGPSLGPRGAAAGDPWIKNRARATLTAAAKLPPCLATVTARSLSGMPTASLSAEGI